MRIKNAACAVGAAAALAFACAGTASAADADVFNCADFSTQVKIVDGYDPNHLDNNNDGIGCDDNPAPATAYDKYSNLKGEGDSNPAPAVTPSQTLPQTGAGDVIHTHPYRSLGAGALVIVAGVATLTLVRRRTEDQGV